MNCYLDDFIKYSEEEIQNKISKLKPIKYNKFRWWRLFEDEHEPLSKREPLENRVLNNDFEFPTFIWQTQYVLIQARKKLNLNKDTLSEQVEKTSLDLARYRKLMQDQEREESKRLNEFMEAFKETFNISQETLDEKLNLWFGDIKGFYYYMSHNYNLSSKENRKLNKKFLNGKNKS